MKHNAQYRLTIALETETSDDLGWLIEGIIRTAMTLERVRRVQVTTGAVTCNAWEDKTPQWEDKTPQRPERI